MRLGDFEVEQPGDKMEKKENGRGRDGVGGEDGRRKEVDGVEKVLSGCYRVNNL